MRRQRGNLAEDAVRICRRVGGMAEISRDFRLPIRCGPAITGKRRAKDGYGSILKSQLADESRHLVVNAVDKVVLILTARGHVSLPPLGFALGGLIQPARVGWIALQSTDFHLGRQMHWLNHFPIFRSRPPRTRGDDWSAQRIPGDRRTVRLPPLAGGERIIRMTRATG